MYNLFVQEFYLNSKTTKVIEQSDVYESCFTSQEELYNACLDEFGPCLRTITLTEEDKTITTIGWCFWQTDVTEVFIVLKKEQTNV